jgi:hypothetical protein
MNGKVLDYWIVVLQDEFNRALYLQVPQSVHSLEPRIPTSVCNY